jgi:hypothetical protein
VPDPTSLRLDALHRRLRQLEEHIARMHQQLGLGDVPERPAPLGHEVAAVAELLSEGREEEALRLHRDLTGQGDLESRQALESIRAGL